MTKLKARTSNTPRALRPGAAAKAYGIGRTLIYKWMDEGTIPSVKIGGARLIPVDALEALLAKAT